MAISKVTPSRTVIWPLSGSISKSNASAPESLYISVSFSSTSLAVTAGPTKAPASASSGTERAVVGERNAGSSFTGVTVMVTAAMFESRPSWSLTR